MFCLGFLEILGEAALGFPLRTGGARGSKQRLFLMGKKCRQTGVGWVLHGAGWLIPVPSLLPIGMCI